MFLLVVFTCGLSFRLVLAIGVMKCSLKCSHMYFSKGDQLCSVTTERGKIALHLRGYEYEIDQLEVGGCHDQDVGASGVYLD